MNTILLDVPDQISTDRLTLRPPRLGDGKVVCSSVLASIEELKTWLPWATDAYDEGAAEEWCRKCAANFVTRTEMPYCIFTKDGRHAGNIGAFRFDWAIPACEIGYWLRTDLVGQGLMAEATQSLCSMLAGTLRVRRIQIRCDDLNSRSAAVAVRCGFTLDGTIRHAHRRSNGSIVDERVYSRLFID